MFCCLKLVPCHFILFLFILPFYNRDNNSKGSTIYVWLILSSHLFTSNAHFALSIQNQTKLFGCKYSDDNVTGILPNAFTAYTQNQEFIGKHAHDACTPFSATLYSQTGVCGGIPSFVVFAPGRGLWVLVGAASTRRF